MALYTLENDSPGKGHTTSRSLERYVSRMCGMRGVRTQASGPGADGGGKVRGRALGNAAECEPWGDLDWSELLQEAQ